MVDCLNASNLSHNESQQLRQKNMVSSMKRALTAVYARNTCRGPSTAAYIEVIVTEIIMFMILSAASTYFVLLCHILNNYRPHLHVSYTAIILLGIHICMRSLAVL